ncbi:MAG TPA: phospholipase D-like domain-containing protein [Opitutaceae bacterium]|nr:phospholipase D-like domain-containing protein [Opitutaceae bacterium]
MPDTAQLTSPASPAVTTAIARPGSLKARPPVHRQSGFFWHLLAIFTGLLCGFSALLLAHRYLSARLFPAAKIQINYAVFTTPSPSLFQEVYAPAIKSARRQILVAAREISSRKLLEALRTRAMDGVDVEFLLSPDVDNRGTIRWITGNQAGRVYVDSQPLADQLLIIDGNKVILTSLPFTADAPAGIQSSGLAVEDAGLGRQLSQQFLKKISQLPLVQQ